MDAKLTKLRPMLDAFKEAIQEERGNGASDAKIEAMDAKIETMIAYAVETNTERVDPDVLEFMVAELREVARSTHQGSGTVQ